MKPLLHALCALSILCCLLPDRPVEAATARQIAAAVKRINAQAKLKRKAPAVRRVSRPVARAHRAYAARHRRTRAYRSRVAARPKPKPPEPVQPVFLGDLFIQHANTPLWTVAGGGQQLGSLPRATIVTNMGRRGAYYKVEAPNGSVGYVSARALGKTSPPW